MTAERYRNIYRWLAVHPKMRCIIITANKYLPAIPFCCYPILLVMVWLQCAAAREPWPLLARAVLVPAFAFGAGTILRKKLNRPRPYEQAGFVPLVQKETKGRSFPSRHALSAAVLSMAWLRFYLVAGACMALITLAICALRVLAGVHHGRDVAAGAALGFALGALMWV